MSRRSDTDLTRRRFLRVGAAGATAAVGGCTLWSKSDGPSRPGTAARPDTAVKPTTKAAAPKPTTKAAAPPPPPPPYGRYQMGVQSYCFHRGFTFDDAVTKAAELGLHYIEPFPGHLPANSKPERLAAVKALLADKQVTMNAYGVCGFSKNEAQARKLFEFCKKLGIGVISADPAPDSLDMLDKLVAEYDLKIAIHNHGPGTPWGETEKLYNGTKTHDPRIGVCLDTGHLARSGDCSIACVRKLGPRIHGLHIKDWTEATPPAKRQDVVIGKGVFDLEAFFTALKETNFDGPISVEWERDFKNPVPGIAASLEALRAVIAKVG